MVRAPAPGATIDESNALPEVGAFGIVVGPAGTQYVYSLNQGQTGHSYVSHDHGKSWTLLSIGGVQGFRFDPAVPGRVIALGPHLQVSNDDGLTWTENPSLAAFGDTTDVAVSSSSTYVATVGGRVFTASDPLGTWTATSGYHGMTCALRTASGRVAVLGSQGFAFSSGPASTLPFPEVSALAITRTSSTAERLVAIGPATPGHTFRLDPDTSPRWQGLLETGFPSGARGVAADAVGPFVLGNDGLFRYDPQAMAWVYKAIATIGYVQQVVVGEGSQQPLLAVGDGGAWTSIDRGDTWTQFAPQVSGIAWLITVPGQPASVYLLANDRIYFTADGGQTIEDHGSAGSLFYRTVAVAGTNADHLVANLGGIISYSTDGGRSWSECSPAFSKQAGLTLVAPEPGGSVWVFDNDKLYHSANLCQGFSLIAQGLFSIPTALVPSLIHPGVLWAVDGSGHGVVRIDANVP